MRPILSMLFVATMAPGIALAQPAPAKPAAAPAAGAKPGPAAAGKPTAFNPVTNDLAQRAIAAAQKDNFDEAQNLFREAYRIDRNPRWLYNMGVLYDRMANCDDAAFFYRAALYGKGVLPQDVDAVDNRLGVLQDECKFKDKHKLASDRHDRAGRYLGIKLCFLAEDILTGIITADEKKKVQECKDEVAQKK